jgi:hypothetical protein
MPTILLDMSTDFKSLLPWLATGLGLLSRSVDLDMNIEQTEGL